MRYDVACIEIYTNILDDGCFVFYLLDAQTLYFNTFIIVIINY